MAKLPSSLWRQWRHCRHDRRVDLPLLRAMPVPPTPLVLKEDPHGALLSSLPPALSRAPANPKRTLAQAPAAAASSLQSPATPAARSQAVAATSSASTSATSPRKALGREPRKHRHRPRLPRHGRRASSTVASPSGLPVRRRPRPRAPGELMTLMRIFSPSPALCSAARTVHRRRPPLAMVPGKPPVTIWSFFPLPLTRLRLLYRLGQEPPRNFAPKRRICARHPRCPPADVS